jgi:hypothetical protein
MRADICTVACSRQWPQVNKTWCGAIGEMEVVAMGHRPQRGHFMSKSSSARCTMLLVTVAFPLDFIHQIVVARGCSRVALYDTGDALLRPIETLANSLRTSSRQMTRSWVVASGLAKTEFEMLEAQLPIFTAELRWLERAHTRRPTKQPAVL